MRATALLVAVEYIVDFPSHVTGHEQEVSYGTCDTPITYREHSGSPIAVDGREKSETDQLPWTIEEFAVSRRFTQKKYVDPGSGDKQSVRPLEEQLTPTSSPHR